MFVAQRLGDGWNVVRDTTLKKGSALLTLKKEERKYWCCCIKRVSFYDIVERRGPGMGWGAFRRRRRCCQLWRRCHFKRERLDRPRQSRQRISPILCLCVHKEGSSPRRLCVYTRSNTPFMKKANKFQSVCILARCVFWFLILDSLATFLLLLFLLVVITEKSLYFFLFFLGNEKTVSPLHKRCPGALL